MSSERFELHAEPAPRDNMRLRYISKSEFGDDWHSTPHTHKCCEMFYCVHGSGQFHIEGELYNVCTGDLVVVNSNVSHTELSPPSDNPLEYIVLGIDGTEFYFSENSAEFAIIDCTKSQESVLFFLHLLLEEMEEQGDGSETVCHDLLEAMLIRLLRNHNFKFANTEEKRLSKECALVRRYIDEHYAEPLTLERLAHLAHINKYHLAHTFAKECGTSPINYLIARRIAESRYLLANTDHPLSQIAYMLGFSSPSYFSQAFKRQEKISPAEYRRSAAAKK